MKKYLKTPEEVIVALKGVKRLNAKTVVLSIHYKMDFLLKRAKGPGL